MPRSLVKEWREEAEEAGINVRISPLPEGYSFPTTPLSEPWSKEEKKPEPQPRSNASAGAEKTSIVPAHPERIRTYRSGVSRVQEIANVCFYASSNPFFERYPASAALKVYFTDEATIATALEGAQKLTP